MIGIEYGITVIKKENEGWGYYNLGKRTNKQSIINNYINNIENYENFISELQIKRHSTLEEAKKLKFSISKNLKIPERKNLGRYFGELYLTHRELQCVKYLSIGKTTEEIAIIFNISKRTIETHIENLKRKFNCYNQFSLGYLLGKLEIKNLNEI
jgi:DNA-binding CsgD family transcriptional regulator